MKILRILPLIFIVWGSPVSAFEMSGHQLFKQLKDYYIEKGMTNEEFLNAGRGYGYVSGVYDSLREKYNIPNEVKPSQIIATVYQFLHKNPHLLHRRASSVVNQAISEAFPLEKEE